MLPEGNLSVRMRIDSALQSPLTDLNDLHTEGHSGDKRSRAPRVGRDSVPSGPQSSQSHAPFPSCPRTYVCRVVADRSLCKACILVCAAVSQRDAVAVLGSVLYDVKHFSARRLR